MARELTRVIPELNRRDRKMPVVPRPVRPQPSTVGAVFVTYHPDPGVAARIAAVASQVSAVIIIDNGSTDAELAPLERLAGRGVIELLRNNENRGLATALNQGLTWGELRGLEWVATFDQDTHAGPDLVAEAGAVFDLRQETDIAVIGAAWVTRPEYQPQCSNPAGIALPCVITSGTLHAVAVWRALGGFRDDFFIDYVDTEYCLRARARGFAVIRTCRVTMTHAIGFPTRRSLYFRSVTPNNHSAIRRYYITRNRLAVWRSYWRTETGYIAFDVKAAVKEFIKLVLLEDDRVSKIRSIIRGTWDFMRGVHGPLVQ